MASDTPIILNNTGNDRYIQISREILANPIITDFLKVILNNASQLDNVIQIRNEKSFGSLWNRDISLKGYTNAINKTNLILDIPLNPEITLDGNTYFQTVLLGNTEIDLLFYYNQEEVSGLLR